MIVETDIASRGIQRIAAALAARPIDLPHKVFHVVGRLDKLKRDLALFRRESDDPYMIVQYVLRSSQKPSTDDWLPLWRDAALVWSYYDLYELCREDGNNPDFEFYRSPLGIEGAFKRPFSRRKQHDFTVLTHGEYLRQGVRECVMAADGIKGGKTAHIDADEPGEFPGHKVTFFHDPSDLELAKLYSRCRYVSGLRRTEGFELPAAEGLACGARPILFDRPHYKDWYGDHAVYIEELPRPEVLEQLQELFAKKYRAVTKAEQTWAQKTFDWDTIISGLYARL